MKTRNSCACVALSLLPALSPMTWASGIYVDSQNAVGVGNANSGTSALAEDASTVFYNPAGMTQLGTGQHFSGIVTYAQVDSTFENDGSTQIDPLVPLGAQESEVSRDAWIPALYYVASMSSGVHIGLGLSPTFGNAGEWDEDFIGRYQGSDTTIEGLNFNPSVSFQLNPQVSLGFGVNYLRLDAELVSKTPVLAGGAFLGDCELIMEGSDGGWGYNVGLLVRATPQTRLGLTYRSTIKLDVRGTVALKTSLFNVSIPGQLDIVMPDIAALGVVHQLNSQWDLLADLSWFGWSTVPGIEVQQRPSGTVLQYDELRFDNGVRAGLGLTWRMATQTTLRAGIALDTTVADQPEYLSVRFPDNDRKWVAVGGTFHLSPTASVDVGYSHAFVDDARVNRVTPLNNAPTSQTVSGTFSSDADLLSVQWNQRF